MIRLMSFLFLWLPFTTAAKTTYTPCKLCIDRASQSTLEKIELRLYIGPTIDNYRSVRVGEALQLFDLIDNSKPTAFFTFGYLGTPDLPSTQAVINAYLARKDHNIFLFNWEGISNQFPTYSILSVPHAKKSPVKFTMRRLHTGSDTQPVCSTWICKFADLLKNTLISCCLESQKDGGLKTLVLGLDPAGPAKNAWGVGDAEFVIIIHTNRGGLGIIFQIGDVDFYPNNGVSVQPGCLLGLDICSHYRSVYFYAESVQHEDSFIGISCDSYSNFIAGSCRSNSKTVMGYATPTAARGRYHLQTNSDPLYGRGEDGAILQTPIASLFQIVSI